MNLKIRTPKWFIPLLENARYKGAFGGRGSGKSHAFAEYIIERCIMHRTDVVCIREIQKSLKYSAKKLIELKIEALGVGSYFIVQESQILCRNGGRIIFIGMQNHTADSIKSLEGYDISWVEEAQSISQRSLDLLRPTMRANDAELLFTWNPYLSTDPIDKLLRGEFLPKNSIVVNVNYQDNPWFPSVLKDEMEYDKRRDPDKYAHVWLGEYVKNSEARVFKNWRIEEFDRPTGVTYRFGADWGYSVDPTVLIRCSVFANTLYIDYESYAVGCEIVNLPALFDRIPKSHVWPLRVDSARPETIDYMRKHGYPKIEAARKGSGSVEEGIQFLQSFDIVVNPRCKHVIDELTLYGYKTDKHTGEILPILEDKNNHCIDALRYATESLRKSSGFTISQSVLESA